MPVEHLLETGDESRVILWGGAAVISLAGIAVVLRKLFKKVDEGEIDNLTDSWYFVIG